MSALHVSGMNTALLKIMKSKNIKILCSKLLQDFVLLLQKFQPTVYTAQNFQQGRYSHGAREVLDL